MVSNHSWPQSGELGIECVLRPSIFIGGGSGRGQSYDVNRSWVLLRAATSRSTPKTRHYWLGLCVYERGIAELTVIFS